MRKQLLLLAVLTGAAAAFVAPRSEHASPPPRPDVAAFAPPLCFEPNLGQTNGAARFVARTDAGTLFLAQDAAVVVTRGATPVAVRMEFPGARGDAEMQAGATMAGTSSYFAGSDPSRWISGVPRHESVTYRELWDGVDLVCRGNPTRLEYDFVVAPGADPSQVALAFSGQDSARVDASGDLVLTTVGGDVRHGRPVAYQDVDGERRIVPASWTVADGGRAAFALGAYDASRELVIDPTLTFSTLIGGASEDYARDIALGQDGSIFVAGQTDSVTDFPTTVGALQTQFGTGTRHGFVTRFLPDGSGVVYSTYLGGTGFDRLGAIAVDATGAAYVLGEAYTGTQFPTTPGAFQTSYGGGDSDLTVAKLSPDGSALVWSTYVGGTGTDAAAPQGAFPAKLAIEVDANGSVYFTGTSGSTDFPTTAGAFQRTFGGANSDAVVVRLNAAGSALVFSTYIGGNGREAGRGIGVDANGNCYVTGFTESSNFPTVSPFRQNVDGALPDTFVAKLTASGSVTWCTTLGANGIDEGLGLALDPDGAPVIVGVGDNAFPITPNAFRSSFPASTAQDTAAYVLKMNAAGTQIVFSTFVSGRAFEESRDIAVDGRGRPCVAGRVDRTGFPVTNSFTAPAGGGADVFVCLLAADGRSQVHSTVFGGSGIDDVDCIATRGGAVFLGGYTFPQGAIPFPTTAGAFQTAPGGLVDAWVAKIQGDDDGGGGGGGDPGFAPVKGTLTDSSKAGKDKAQLNGTVPVLGKTYDPRADGGAVQFGDPADPTTVDIPANDPGWKGKKGKWTWKSPRATFPKVVVNVNAVKGSFSVTASRFDFVTPVGAQVYVALTAGAAKGAQTVTFELRANGKFQLKP